MIKVLHYYSGDDSLIARYVTLIAAETASWVDSAKADSPASLKQQYKQWHPDIIHVYGVPSWPALDARIVISPFGKNVQTNDYYAIIARSPHEAERLVKEGFSHVETVLNPLVTKTAQFDKTAAQMVGIYRKVMNSNPLALMNADTLMALGLTLKAAVMGKKEWITQKWPASSIQFPLLYIYSDLENISDYVNKGLNVLGIEAPKRETAYSYLPNDYRKPKSMTGHPIADMLADIRQDGMNMLRLVNLYEALSDEKLDEDELVKTLEQQNDISLFSSILQIEQEYLYLDEGFMPVIPSDNAETTKLRQDLINHLRL